MNDRGWRLRELLRIMLLAVPVIAGVMFLPGDIGPRVTTESFLVVGAGVRRVGVLQRVRYLSVAAARPAAAVRPDPDWVTCG